MDGASFDMTESAVKSEVIASEEEDARLENEKQQLIAAMAAKQELKEMQLLQDLQDTSSTVPNQQKAGADMTESNVYDLQPGENTEHREWVSKPVPPKKIGHQHH